MERYPEAGGRVDGHDGKHGLQQDGIASISAGVCVGGDLCGWGRGSSAQGSSDCWKVTPVPSVYPSVPHKAP